MKMKYAVLENEEKIFKLWHKEKDTIIRIFGLSESIDNGEVFICENDNEEIIGFVRFNLASNKTNDYIKINEVFIDTDKEEEEKYFFKAISDFIFVHGYTVAKVTDTIGYHDVLVRNGFEVEGVKVKISADETYPNIIFVKKVDPEDVAKISFGSLLS